MIGTTINNAINGAANAVFGRTSAGFGSLFGGLGGSVLGMIGQGIGTAITNRRQRQLMDHQYNLQMKAWREMAAYNSPAQQMARYQEAGLNPNLIYGSGASSAGNVNSFPQYQAPTLARHQEFDNLGNEVINSIFRYRQLKNLEQQGRLIEAQTNVAHHQADVQMATAMSIMAGVPGMRANSIMRNIESHYYEDKQKYAVEQAAQDIEETKAKIKLIGQQVTNAKLDEELKKIQKNLAPYQMQQVKALVRKTLLEGDILQWQLGLREIGLPPNAPWLVTLAASLIGEENVKFFTSRLKLWIKQVIDTDFR